MRRSPVLCRWAAFCRSTVDSSRPHRTLNKPSTKRFQSSSTSKRTYADALQKLSLLQSNRTTTQLFDQPSSASSGDPNAAAIPEMKAWLRRAGYTPEDLARMRHIHVAGTKGKGSVCAYATAMLKRWRSQYGLTGTYTSPHLVSPRERIAIDGVPVTQNAFAAGFFEIWDRMSEAARREGMSAVEAEGPGSKPFYFRFMTILAWHIFLSQGVKNVVLECGIGGEYDATNIVPAKAVSAAVISQLGIDHVAMLGDTVEKIAWHKAGIFKSGVAAFTRRLDKQPEVMKVLRARAEEKGATLVEVRDKDVEAWGGVKCSLQGEFQKYNQTLAVLAVQEHLRMDSKGSKSYDMPWEQGAIIDADLQKVKLRGRGEIVEDEQVTWFLDGAHNKDSLEGVAAWLAREVQDGESVILVFNQMDRDASELLRDFVKTATKVVGREDVFSHALFATNDVERPAVDEKRDTSVQEKAAATMRQLRPRCEVQIFDNLTDTVDAARSKAQKRGDKQKVLVTGSMHLVGGLLRTIEPKSQL